jgi:hypothetical protein
MDALKISLASASEHSSDELFLDQLHYYGNYVYIQQVGWKVLPLIEVWKVTGSDLRRDSVRTLDFLSQLYQAFQQMFL